MRNPYGMLGTDELVMLGAAQMNGRAYVVMGYDDLMGADVVAGDVVMGDDGQAYVLGEDGTPYILGSDAAMGALQRKAQRFGGGRPAPRGVPVRTSVPFSVGAKPIGPAVGEELITFNTDSWAAGTAANTVKTLTATIQKSMQFVRPSIQITRSSGASGVPIAVTQFQLGTDSLFVTNSGSVPAEALSPLAVGVNTTPKTLAPGCQVTIQLTNLAAIPAGESVFVQAGGFVRALT